MFFCLYCLTAIVSANKNMTIIEHDVRVISSGFKDFCVIKDLHGEVPTLLKFKFKKWYKIAQSGKENCIFYLHYYIKFWRSNLIAGAPIYFKKAWIFSRLKKKYICLTLFQIMNQEKVLNNSPLLYIKRSIRKEKKTAIII